MLTKEQLDKLAEESKTKVSRNPAPKIGTHLLMLKRARTRSNKVMGIVNGQPQQMDVVTAYILTARVLESTSEVVGTDVDIWFSWNDPRPYAQTSDPKKVFAVVEAVGKSLDLPVSDDLAKSIFETEFGGAGIKLTLRVTKGKATKKDGSPKDLKPGQEPFPYHDWFPVAGQDIAAGRALLGIAA